MRGRSIVEIDEGQSPTPSIITEIPYQVNKARCSSPRSPECMREKRIEGISEVRDESDREGMRIVIELKKDEIFPQVILNQLYRLTNMQATSGSSTSPSPTAARRPQPHKETLAHFIEHRPRRRQPAAAAQGLPPGDEAQRGKAGRRPGHGHDRHQSTSSHHHPLQRRRGSTSTMAARPAPPPPGRVPPPRRPPRARVRLEARAARVRLFPLRP